MYFDLLINEKIPSVYYCSSCLFIQLLLPKHFDIHLAAKSQFLTCLWHLTLMNILWFGFLYNNPPSFIDMMLTLGFCNWLNDAHLHTLSIKFAGKARRYLNQMDCFEIIIKATFKKNIHGLLIFNQTNKKINESKSSLWPRAQH